MQGGACTAGRNVSAIRRPWTGIGGRVRTRSRVGAVVVHAAVPVVEPGPVGIGGVSAIAWMMLGHGYDVSRAMREKREKEKV